MELAPNVNFGSAFAINYFFEPAYTTDSGMMMYYWGPNAVSSNPVLTTENASGYMPMVDKGGYFWGDLSGISARLINQPAYVAGVYVSDGVTYTTGILPYSLGQYCKSIASRDGNSTQDLAKHTAVYGYYAKIYFNT